MDIIEAAKEHDRLVFKAVSYSRLTQALNLEIPRVDLFSETVADLDHCKVITGFTPEEVLLLCSILQENVKNLSFTPPGNWSRDLGISTKNRINRGRKSLKITF